MAISTLADMMRISWLESRGISWTIRRLWSVWGEQSIKQIVKIAVANEPDVAGVYGII